MAKTKEALETEKNIPTESDIAAETAMNSAETIESTPETEVIDPNTVQLPQNEYDWLVEVMKSPIKADRLQNLIEKDLISADYSTDNLYQVELDTPDKVFGSKGSRKNLSQSVKKAIIGRGVIRSIADGAPGPLGRAVIEVVNPNFALKVTKDPSAKATGKRRGRPSKEESAAKALATPAANAPKKRGPKSKLEKEALQVQTPGVSVEKLRKSLMVDVTELEKFLKWYADGATKYGQYFGKAGIPQPK